jgi:peptidyl-prolyl cis-trans isomerase SurA
MKLGEVSNPVRTNFGWHLIKLLEKNPPPPFEEASQLIRSSVMQDSRSFLSEQVVVDRLKKEYNFKINNEGLKDFYQLVDSTIFSATWKPNPSLKLQKVIFSFDGVDFIQQDFADFLQANQSNSPPASIQGYVGSMLDEMAKRKLLEHENAMLELKFPEFKAIVNEYHDGMLLFEITNQNVWNKAIQDSLGLNEFFAANRGNYVWPDRVNARIFTFETLSDAKSFNPKSENQKYASKEEGIFSKGQHSIIDGIEWKNGATKPFSVGNKFVVVDILENLPSGYQELDEVKGYVINDYQNYLDKKWIGELRMKHEVEVNYDLLKTISN